MEYKIILTSKEIGIIQDSLSHIGDVIDIELIKNNIKKQFVEQLTKQN